MNDYNFEMTGKPSDNELATYPDLANAWYAFSGTSPEPAPTTPPIWLRPEDYTANNFAAPYTQQQANTPVNPSDIRQGAGGVSYAGLTGNSSYYDPTSAGEYVVDPKTNQFVKDANGNLIPVPRPNTTSNGWFNDWGVLAVPLLAAGGVAALEGLGAIGGGAELMGPTYGELGYTGLAEGAMGPTYAELGYTGLNSAEAIAAADAAAASALAAEAGGAITASQALNALKAGATVASLAKTLGLTGTNANKAAANALRNFNPTATTQTPTANNAGLASQLAGTGFGLSKGNVNPFLFSKELPVQTQTASKADPFAALNVPQTPIQPFNPLAHIVG